MIPTGSNDVKGLTSHHPYPGLKILAVFITNIRNKVRIWKTIEDFFLMYCKYLQIQPPRAKSLMKSVAAKNAGE